MKKINYIIFSLFIFMLNVGGCLAYEFSPNSKYLKISYDNSREVILYVPSNQIQNLEIYQDKIINNSSTTITFVNVTNDNRIYSIPSFSKLRYRTNTSDYQTINNYKIIETNINNTSFNHIINNYQVILVFLIFMILTLKIGRWH